MSKDDRTPSLRFKGYSDAWELRKLGDCGMTYTGLSGKSKEDFGHGQAKYVTYMNVYSNPIADVSMVDSIEIDRKQYTVSYGDVFFTTSSETPDEVGMSSIWLDNTDNIYLNSFCFGYRPSIEWDSYFLGYMLRSDVVRRNIVLLAQGISRYNISKTKLMDINVKYPCAAEQTKVGAMLKSIDDLITLHQRKYDKLIEVKKSLLDKMFPAAGESEPKIRFKGFTDAWEQRKLDDVAIRYDNLRIPVASNLRISGTTPYYGANGIQDFVEGYTHEGEFVLVAEDGANNLNDYPVRYVNGRIWVNNHAHVLQGKSELVDNKFLAFSIKHADIESVIVGGSRAKLNAEILMDIIISLPQIAEQTKVGDLIALLDNIITLHQRMLEKLKNVKLSLLEKMFV